MEKVRLRFEEFKRLKEKLKNFDKISDFDKEEVKF